MILDVIGQAWFNRDEQFVPGEVLFASERKLALWAYTVSHSQLLFRTRNTDEESRIDVLFKPVDAVRIRTDYDGLVVRCATAEERGEVLAEVGGHHRVLILESGGVSDYVVAMAFGWREEWADIRDESSLAGFAPGTDPHRILGAPD
jgi:hypothetical protein